MQKILVIVATLLVTTFFTGCNITNNKVTDDIDKVKDEVTEVKDNALEDMEKNKIKNENNSVTDNTETNTINE
ncbi:MAG: hypothetical protein RR904_07335 [Bacilli bacterium]